MKVPQGGSSCASCEYLKADGKSCGNSYFVRWNDGKSKLPEKANTYCCDFWKPESRESKSPSSLGALSRAQHERKTA